MKIQRRIILVIAAALLGLCACGGSSGSGIVQSRMGSGTVKKAEREEAVSEEETEQTAPEDALYVVTGIDTDRKTAAFEKLGSGRQVQYPYDTGTRFLNKYGDSMAASSVVPGDVAELRVSSETDCLTSLQLSDQVWVQENIGNYSVDEEKRAFTIGQTKYSYEEGMKIFSGASRVDFSALGSSDVLRAVGIDKKLISLSVTEGHGYLALSNTELFEDSFICVGSKIFELVTKDMKLEVPEGRHLVTVANNGYGGSREVVVERNQTTSLNLDELKGEGPKFCEITFTVGVEGAVLEIDGEEVDYSKPVKVQYGIHTIAVGAAGYDTITEKLVVNSQKAELEIALTSSSSSASDSSENTSENSSGSSGTADNNSGGSAGNGGNNTNSSNSTADSSSGNTGGNSGSNGNTDGSNSSSNSDTDNGANDYLTTLYNLLNSINNSGTTGSSGTTNNSSGTSDSYDNLVDQ